MVELLVVVSIIALLIAILLPSLRKARRQAKQVKCQSQLKQIATAWQDYLVDHDDHFLQGSLYQYNYGGRQGNGLGEYGADPMDPVEKPLNYYMQLPTVVYEGAEVFQCPADRGGENVRPSFFEYYGSSYMTNVMLIGSNQLQVNPWVDPCAQLMYRINKRLRQLNRSRIGNESKLVLMGDAGWGKTWECCTVEWVDWHGVPCTHNVAFMDGHVDFIRIRKGLLTTDDYTVIPFKDLQDEAFDCQEEKPCE